ncbi:MAG: phosphoribosylaminoimidazolesuccinocarboxamide synthase [Flavobacteriales bacterium]|nr:phosphoribosylaminoimidazolesuccinocarboxamide synthase [Flavobacteriales bacterium]
MTPTLTQTQLDISGIKHIYRGKVRDVYSLQNGLLVMIATDRISAFDVILPRGIPHKGQVLNQIAGFFLEATSDIVPNWRMASPDPVVSVGRHCTPIKLEMVIRGYLTGHAWREYSAGKRTLCGVALPEGLKENDPFPEPIITPATKADEGHDEDISRVEILQRNILHEADYTQLEAYTRALYARGTEMARQRGLILVDTKYEFGHDAEGKIRLIDEIHTPDSSRYFYLEGYEERQNRGERQRQLSKEFVREWLMAGGFQGRAGEQMPEMTDRFIEQVSNRYIELYEMVTGREFIPADNQDIMQRVQVAVAAYLQGFNG